MSSRAPTLTSGATLAAREGATSRWREWYALWGVVALALGVRFVVALVVPRVIKWDEPDYLRLGYNLLHGAGFTTGLTPEVHYTPLFPVVSGVSYLLVRDWEWAANLPYVVCGAGLLLPVYGLGRRLYGGATAWVAVLLLALFPPLVTGVLFWGTMTEPLYLLLIYLALWFTWQLLDPAPPVLPQPMRAKRALLVGCCLGLAYLTRPEAITYLALILGLMLLLGLPDGGGRRVAWRPTLGVLGIVGGTFFLMAAPYLFYLYQVTGHWTMTGKLGVTWAIGQAVIDADPAEYDRVTASLDAAGQEIVWFSPDRFHTSLTALIMADPLGFGRRVVQNVRQWQSAFFAGTAYAPALLLFAGLALFGTPWSRARLRRELFLVGAALPVVTFFPFHVELRFFSPAFPVVLLWTAHGITLVSQWAHTMWQMHGEHQVSGGGTWPGVVAWGWRWGPVLGVLCFLGAMNLLAAREGIRITKYGHKEAGLWLRDHTPPEASVMTRDLAVALYAERRWVASPRASWPRFLAYAVTHEADYLLIDRWEVTQVRPDFAFLLDKRVSEVKLVWEQLDESEGTRLFRFAAAP